MAQELKEQKPDARVVYADIFHLPHWQSPTRKPMSAYERAAIFSPFAALDGYEEIVDEEARVVGKQQALSENELDILNQKGAQTDIEDRKMFASRAFGVSSHYDTAIHSWFVANK